MHVWHRGRGPRSSSAPRSPTSAPPSHSPPGEPISNVGLILQELWRKYGVFPISAPPWHSPRGEPAMTTEHSLLKNKPVQDDSSGSRLFASSIPSRDVNHLACFTELKAQGPSRTCNENEEEGHDLLNKNGARLLQRFTSLHQARAYVACEEGRSYDVTRSTGTVSRWVLGGRVVRNLI